MTLNSKLSGIKLEIIGLSCRYCDIFEVESILIDKDVPFEKGRSEWRISLPVIPPPIIPILN